ncbi:MAG: hypothetical protein IK096_04245, partial [Lachnospiraceae bacterium]|nr:hypothetical protein [Lachnospiraceae bacterium]
MDDLNLLAYLYMRRDETRDTMNHQDYLEETREQARRANKVLNEICDYLDKTEIRNEQDREKALAHINSYGDLLYNQPAMGGAGNAVDYQQKFAEMRAKKPLAHEFLTDEERREYKESYEQFKAQAGSATLEPTVNGPQTDMERAFLNVESIAVLAEAQGQLEADPELAKDPVLAEARHQTELFLAEVDQFYRNRQLLDPENADKRQESFEKLLSDSTAVVDALGEAEQKLTNEGQKTNFTPAEEKMLKGIRLARAGVDEMRRKYSAQIDFELQRKEDLAAAERKTEQERAEFEERKARYEVDLDYALMTLPEEEQERLMRILNEQRDVQQRFDFATGEMIPAGDLPERIMMDYDDDGNLRPQILIVADKQDRERELEAQEAEQARRDAIRAERAAKREAVPYEEGAADLFEAGDQAFEAQNKEAEKIRERFARNREADRRRSLADETGDERYEWSFAHILRDADEKKQAAGKARDDAANDPATTDARMVELIEKAREARYVSEQMEQAVIFSYDAQSLDREIERRWPQIYKDSYQPGIATWSGTSPSASETGAMNARKRVLQALPPKERYEIMGRLAENLAPAQREELRNRLIGMKAPMSVPYAQQVTKPLHDRIEELKKQKTPANTIGVPLVPERIGAYHEALDYADQVLDEAGTDQIFYGTVIANERENTVNQLRTKQIDQEIARRDDNFRILSASLRSNRPSVLEEGVLPSQEGALQEIVGLKEEHSPEYIRSIGRLMSRMEEMGIDPAAQAEQTYKFYAFSDLAKAKLDLKNAIQDGDPERIIEARQSYEKWRGNMQELVGYAKEHFSPDSAPGNVDTSRNPAVPWEFSGEYTATSQVNGVYQLYSALKQTGVTVQEFVEDHDAAMRRVFAKLDERNSYKEQFKDKSIGTALGTMMAEDGDLESRRLIRVSQENQMVLRGDEMLVEGDPDAARRAQNRATRSLKMAHRNLVTRVRETRRNPFTQQDEARKRQVLGLLSVVSEEDLHADYDRMVCGTYFDAQGRKVAPITAEQYIANKQNIDYTKLGNRGADIIRDALAVPGTTFDPVAFMEERQRVLSSLLITRAADAGKPGFDRLEYEVTHMAEIYDMLRVSNPKMPELTEEQRQRFRASAAQYEEKRRQVQNRLTGEQKNRIAGRRRTAGNIARKARADLLAHEARLNERDAVRRAQERNRQTQENARRQLQEQQRLAEERIRQQEAQIRAELEAELRRQKEA